MARRNVRFGRRRPRWQRLALPVGGAAAAAVVVLIIVVASGSGGEEPTTTTPSTTAATTTIAPAGLEADEVVDLYLEAWAGFDFAEMRGLVDRPPADFTNRHLNWVDDLDLETASFSSSAVQFGQAGAAASVRVTLGLAGLGEWSYDTVLRLRQVSSGWLVDWAPATLHPSLRAGTRFTTTREWGARAPILARDGTPLAATESVVAIGVIPRRIQDRDEVVAAFVEHVGLTEEEVTGVLDTPGAQPDWFLPVITMRPADYEAVRPALFPVPGIVFRAGEARIGPGDELASHLLGNVGEITAELLDRFGAPYRRGDLVGRSGLELGLERTLAGVPSWEVHLVDTTGVVLEVLHRVDGVAPRAVQITIDVVLQHAAEDAVDAIVLLDEEGEPVEVRAAMVVLDAPTGQIRAVVSRPETEFNRALDGLYPPGSTFKIITAAAALGSGIGPDDSIDCPPEVVISGKTFTNAGTFGPGPISFARAFADSCNTAFAPLAASLGEETVGLAAAGFGFGLRYDMPLPASGGSFPPPVDVVELAAGGIGQGRVVASPLHMASVVGAVGSGAWRAPSLLTSDEAEPQPLDPGVVEALRSFMRLVVTDGTGRVANLPGEPVFGKTGSAEFGTGDPPQTHAWFVGLRGDLAFAVLVEAGGSGGGVAAPVAAAFLAAAESASGP